MNTYAVLSLLVAGCSALLSYLAQPVPTTVQKTDAPEVVIWDLNKTLIKVDRIGFAHNTFGLIAGAMYHLSLPKGVTVESRLFATLERIGGKAQGEHIPCSDSGAPLPLLMCQWLDGSWLGTPQDLQKINGELCSLLKSGFFYNKAEYKIIKKMIKSMFTPTVINQHRKPIKKMLKLVKSLQEQDPTCRHVVLSNWDSASFNGFLESKAGKAVLNVIRKEDIIISGSAEVRMNKPHPNIFEYVCNRYQVQPERCLFVDDQQENVESARAVGMHALVTNGKNVQEIEAFYQKLVTKTKSV